MNSKEENYGSDNDSAESDDDYVLLTDTYLKVVDTRDHGGPTSYFTNSLPNIKEEEDYELCDSSRADAKSFLKNESSSVNYPKLPNPVPFGESSNSTLSFAYPKSNAKSYELFSGHENRPGSNAYKNSNLCKMEQINIIPTSRIKPVESEVNMNNKEKASYRIESLNVKPILPTTTTTSTSSTKSNRITDSNNKLSFQSSEIGNEATIVIQSIREHDCPENGSGDYSENRMRRNHNNSIKFENERKDSSEPPSRRLVMPSSCIDFADSIHQDEKENTPQVPSQIFRLREKLKYIYSQYFHHGLDPSPWLQFPNKPKVSCLVEGRVRRILSSSHLVGPPVTAMDLKFQLGRHVMLKGDTGSGKSTWLRRFAYQYGLSLLPYIDEEFDVVLYLQADMFPVTFRSDFLDLSEFLSIILPSYCFENEFRSFCVNWMLKNSDRILFLIDTSFQTFLFLKQLLRKEIFPESTSFFTNSPLFDHSIRSMKMEMTYEMLQWSESDILKYLRHFSQAFSSENDRTIFLECIEGLNCSHLLSLPENCSLICLLYYLDQEQVKKSTISCRTDILQILFTYFIKQQFPHIHPNKRTILPEEVMKILESAWLLIFKQTDEDISIPLTETCSNKSNKISISGWEFGEFLASKFIYLKYNELKLLSPTTNTDRQLRHLFQNCWSIVEQNITSKTMTHSHKLIVFLCRLLGSDFICFLDFLPDHFSTLLPEVAQQRFNKILDDSVVEIAVSLPEISSQINKLKMTNSSSLLMANSSNSNFNFNTLNQNKLKQTQHNNEREITFRGNGQIASDCNSVIEKQLDEIDGCPQLNSLNVIFYMDDLSLENLQKACLVFQKPLKLLITLNIALYFKTSDQMTLQSSLPKIHHVINRFGEFLSKNQDLKSLGLWGGFLLPNTLINIKEEILQHPSLESITLKGQLEMNNQRCLGRFDPYSGIVLSMILEKRLWKYICIDLRGFTSDSKSSLNFNRLARVVSNHDLHERIKGFSIYSTDDSEALNLDQAHVASTSELSNIQSTTQAEQNLISQIIRPVMYHPNLVSIVLRFKSIGFALLDNLSDMIDVCFKLKRLELEVEYIDEEFILSVGSGIVCANSLQSCTVIGKVFRRYASNAGKCITGLIQSCILSHSLRGIQIKISPLYEEDIDWLLISIPSLPNIPRASIRVTIESKVITTDPEKFEEKIKYLKHKTSHRNLDLDCRISAILESSF